MDINGNLIMGSSKRSLQSYKDQAGEIHRGKYNYDQWTDLGKYHDKIAIVCSEHGVFTQSLANHISRKSGCPACRAALLSSGVRSIPINQWIDRANHTHDNKYQYIVPDWFSNADTDQITIICPTHGEFSQTLADHVRKAAGCPQCAVTTRKLTCVERYGVSSAKMQHISHESLALLQDPMWLRMQHVDLQRSYVEIANQLGVQDGTVGRHAKLHGIGNVRYPRSEGEKQIGQMLSDYTNVVCSDRSIIHPLELDIVLPDHNIAIEYCGLYWHSDTFKSPEYHANKHLRCHNAGIKLVTIFEDEWKNTPRLVVSQLLTLIGKPTAAAVDASACTVGLVSTSAKRNFLNSNHFQRDGSSTINYGLYDNGTLVACMGWIVDGDRAYVLDRYATSSNVVDAFSTLIAHFMSTYDWLVIEAVVDVRWHTDHLYRSNQFVETARNQPSYFWTDGKTRWLNSNVEPTNKAKIYDCGSITYQIINSGVL